MGNRGARSALIGAKRDLRLQIGPRIAASCMACQIEQRRDRPNFHLLVTVAVPKIASSLPRLPLFEPSQASMIFLAV
jgi:hypothetical protein